jgi:1,2-dihydroxy-3-keto-5-methylthiopentene dioxygenase
MSHLRIFEQDTPSKPVVDVSDHAAIARALGEVGIRFERWEPSHPVRPGDPSNEIIEAYRTEIERLMTSEGYRTVDVVSLSADHPDKDKLRRKFLDEHTHSEDEVRLFVAGEGLFFLHLQSKVYEVLCTAGDLISVPDGTRHWFDMGPNPNFVAIRLFTDPAGWVANHTGDTIASSFTGLAN